MNDTTTTAAEEVTFHSEAGNYRVVMEPMRRHRVGESNEVEVVGGKDIQFYDGVYTTKDPEEIAFLREYESNGRFYWELGSSADTPGDARGLIREIVKKGYEGDFARVAEILVAERTAQSRPDVLAACEAVLEGADQQLPPKPETPLHEVQRLRVGPAAGVTPGQSPDLVAGSPVVEPSSLEQPPGAPAAPVGEPAVPVGQAPSTDVPGDQPSATMPSAQGPLVGGDTPSDQATVTPETAVVGDGEGPDGAPPTGGSPGGPAAPDEETED